jgi:dipeptidyl aminopeptidase/acylaminoacyl peptidase
MTCPCSVSRYRWMRNLCSLVCIVLGCCSLPATRAQNVDIDKPLLNIDEDISAFAAAPDGRIVYSVRRNFHTKQYDLERDDIWLQENGGKRKRLLQGEKFLRGNTPFSYVIDSFRWSPNGKLILAQLFTTSVVDDRGATQDSTMTLAIEDGGKEIRLSANDNALKDASNASFLQDNSTIVYFTEIVKPKVLFSFKYINIAAGPSGNVFEGRTFLDAYPIPRSNVAIGV